MAAPQKFEQCDTKTMSAKLFQRGSAHILVLSDKVEEIGNGQISKSPPFPATHNGAGRPRQRVCGLRSK
jgi:hypothetical protein